VYNSWQYCTVIETHWLLHAGFYLHLHYPPNFHPLTYNYRHWLQSPYLFVTCALIKADSLEAVKNGQEGKQALTGSLVSSLHRLKDTNNQGRSKIIILCSMITSMSANQNLLAA
jgi:hypothetical protein